MGAIDPSKGQSRRSSGQPISRPLPEWGEAARGRLLVSAWLLFHPCENLSGFAPSSALAFRVLLLGKNNRNLQMTITPQQLSKQMHILQLGYIKVLPSLWGIREILQVFFVELVTERGGKRGE